MFSVKVLIALTSWHITRMLMFPGNLLSLDCEARSLTWWDFQKRRMTPMSRIWWEMSPQAVDVNRSWKEQVHVSVPWSTLLFIIVLLLQPITVRPLWAPAVCMSRAGRDKKNFRFSRNAMNCLNFLWSEKYWVSQKISKNSLYITSVREWHWGADRWIIFSHFTVHQINVNHRFK